MWIEGAHVGVPLRGPCDYGPLVFVNEVEVSDAKIPPGVWKTVDASKDHWEQPTDLPLDVKALHLSGILIITAPGQTANETADFKLWLRRYGVTGWDGDYIGQVTEVQPGGVRSPFACWIAVDRLRFQVSWTKSTVLPYPVHPSYGFKLYADAYLR